MIKLNDINQWLLQLKEVYGEQKEYLTELDAAIGDADHGINMNRGFNAVYEEITKNSPNSISEALKTTGKMLIKSVGGASGPLYGTFFLRAANSTNNKDELGQLDLLALFEAGVQGILDRGKAELGDKTMIDVWVPILETMKQEIQNNRQITCNELMIKVVASAEQNMKNTIAMVAKKGRASYLGDRSKDHQDPGATSTFLMLKTAANIWK